MIPVDVREMHVSAFHYTVTFNLRKRFLKIKVDHKLLVLCRIRIAQDFLSDFTFFHSALQSFYLMWNNIIV